MQQQASPRFRKKCGTTNGSILTANKDTHNLLLWFNMLFTVWSNIFEVYGVHYTTLPLQWTTCFSFDTHRVGGSPLHRDPSPSWRLIFTKASCDKNTSLKIWQQLRIRKQIIHFDDVYLPGCRWNGWVFCTNWCSSSDFDKHRCGPSVRYNTGSTSLCETKEQQHIKTVQPNITGLV